MVKFDRGVHEISYRPIEKAAAKLAYQGIERRLRPPVLGMRIRNFDIEQSAKHILSTPRTDDEGVGLFVTPNVQHVAIARQNREFEEALQSAQIIVADGFPVYRFARLRGLSLPGRITGREVIKRMFAEPAALAGHRAYFVVDSDQTAQLIEAWIMADFNGLACRTRVPPFGFDRDAAQCTELAGDIARFGTTLLFLCIGAPKSELFVHRQRDLLPPCWSLCVGQSFRLMLGTTAPPPALMVRLHLEWLWRILLEPKRMLRRYVPSTVGFGKAMFADLRRR